MNPYSVHFDENVVISLLNSVYPAASHYPNDAPLEQDGSGLHFTKGLWAHNPNLKNKFMLLLGEE